MHPDDPSRERGHSAGREPSPDAVLVARMRSGDAAAGDRFFHEHYPAICRYLLWLTGQPEVAEDLAQETLVRAWRHLDAYDGRAPLSVWLHRIAHREFLRFWRSRRPQAALEDIPEIAEPRAVELTEAVELREVIQKLPLAEQAVVVLHYLQGYTCEEIAPIVRAPVGTVKYRLSAARAHLRRELGEGDMAYLNEPGARMRGWAWLPPDQIIALEARIGRVESRELRVESARTHAPNAVDLSTLNSQLSTDEKGEAEMSDGTSAGISRRALLEAAGAAAAAAAITGLTAPVEAAAASPSPADAIDSRLTRKMTLAFKATALSDLCAALQEESGVPITAGPSVADEKVTLFCEKLPLREVMRQLSRPFGYTWVRSGQAFRRSGVQAFGKDGADLNARTRERVPAERLNVSYRYELVQDLRSQLLEEELRNRDRNAALLALDREVERYRPYLDLSPDEALERSKTAPAGEKELLERYAGPAWGLAQLYFRLSPAQQAALRAGQPLLFSPAPEPGEFLLPPALARGVLESQRHLHVFKKEKGIELGSAAGFPEGQPLTAIPEAQPAVSLILGQTGQDQFTMAGGVGFVVGASPHLPLRDWQEAVNSFAYGGSSTFALCAPGAGNLIGQNVLATGRGSADDGPKNEILNARLARDPALRRRVTVGLGARGQGAGVRGQGIGGRGQRLGGGLTGSPSQSKVQTAHAKEHPKSEITSADVLEGLHGATGMPIVADFFTHLYAEEAISVRDEPLFTALNRLGDAMGLRWHKEGDWLQFRSARFYEERLEEVPNRRLARWAAARQAQGLLSPDDLVEIAQLSDPQLDSDAMAEGVKECWGLPEWDLARARHLRAHLRFLGQLTPEQRWETLRPAGLPFSRMSLAQQQQFLALTLGARAGELNVSLEDLGSAALRVEYRVTGDRLWQAPEQPGRPGQLVRRPPVPENRRQFALENARRFHDQRPEEEILARLEPVWDLEFSYTIGTEPRLIRRRAGINGGGLSLPDE